VVTGWDQLGLHDGVQSHSVDGCSGSLGNDDEKSALELEVYEERDVVGTLLTLGQLGEDQESPPTLSSLGDSHTLPDGSHRLEVAFRHTA
jgi:hypothetical protein